MDWEVGRGSESKCVLDCGTQRKGRVFPEVAECVLTYNWCWEGQSVCAQWGGRLEQWGAVDGRDGQSGWAFEVGLSVAVRGSGQSWCIYGRSWWASPLQGWRDKLQAPLCPLCGVRLVRVRMGTDPHSGHWVLAEVWESESSWHHRGICWTKTGTGPPRVHSRLYFLSCSLMVSRMLSS